MFPAVYVVYLIVCVMAGRANDARFPCHKLDVQVKVDIKGTRNRDTWCVIEFNYIDITGYLDPSGGPQMWNGRLEISDFGLEAKICRRQIDILECMSKASGIADVTMTLQYVFHVGHGNWSGYLRANRETFRLRDNQTVVYCVPQARHEARLATLRNGGCGPFLPTEAETSEMRQKWLGMCLEKKRGGRPDKVRQLGFQCREGDVETTTRKAERTSNTETKERNTTGKMEKAMEDSTVGTGREVGTESGWTGGGEEGVTEERREGNGVASAVIVMITVVAAGVGGAWMWKRWRGETGWRCGEGGEK
nr:membrane protein r169 [Murid betaherpesvirus 2]